MTEITSGARPRFLSANLSIKNVLATIHLWIGITFSIPFVLLGLSGSIQMVHHLPERFDAASAPQRPINQIIEAARIIAPEGTRLVGYDAPGTPGANAVVRSAVPLADNTPAHPGPGSAG